MKLRQKLAAVLAATMIVTAVPVVTMAASSNRITKVVKVAKDDIFNNATTAPQLVIDLDDNLAPGSIFYLELNGAEWSKDAFKDVAGNYEAKEVNLTTGALTSATGASEVIMNRVSDKEVQVTVQGDGLTDAEKVLLPLVAKVTGTEATVTVDANNQSITGGTYIFAATSTAKGKVVIGTLPNIYSEGNLADITIEEPYQGAFLAKARELAAAGETQLTLELDLQHKDFKVLTSADTKVSFSKGFSHADLTTATGLQLVENTYSDTLEVKIPVTVFTTDLAAASRGSITLSGVGVKSEVKEPTLGDLAVNVSGDLIDSVDQVVAKVINYGTSLIMKDEKAVEVVAGRDAEITFKLKENVNDSIIAERTIDFTAENGYLGVLNTATGAPSAIAQFGSLITLPAGVSLVDVEVNDDDQFVGFSVKIAAASLDAADIDEFEFKTRVCTDVAQEDKEVTIKAEGRAIDGDAPAVVAAKVKAPVKVTAESMTVKVGLQKQVGGKVTLAETDKAMLKRGDLVLSIPAEEGVKFTKEPVVKVAAGDLRIDESGIKTSYNSSTKAYDVIVPVARESKTASTLEISGFEVTVDRTVPQGSYSLTIAGNALVASHNTFAATHTHGSIEAKDFFVVGTPNTEDIAANGLKKGTASFSIGSANYSINGVQKAMDAQAFLSNDRTMVPVRYVSEAFGIEGKNVLFGSGTVTLFAGTRTVQLTNGSNIAVVNGAKIAMGEKVVIKAGRTYIPMGEVGRILGVTVNWDGATKTATFANN